MNEPVAVPAEPKVEQPRENRSAVDEGQILDEGLDIASYRGTHDSPFVADYFGIGDYYKTNPEISEKVDFITEHLIRKTEGQSLIYVAKQILDQYGEEMNLDPKDTGLYRIKRVIEMIKARDRVDMLEGLKQQAIHDIENMV